MGDIIKLLKITGYYQLQGRAMLLGCKHHLIIIVEFKIKGELYAA